MPKVHEGQLDASGRKFGIVVSRFNDLVTTRLLGGALDCIKRHGGDEDDIEIAWVPGAFELPIAAKKLAATERFDVVMCLGAIIRSDTPHFDYVAGESAKGIARVGQRGLRGGAEGAVRGAEDHDVVGRDEFLDRRE